MGPECFARRSECGFLVARQTLVTAAQHRASIKRKIEQARKRTLKATEPIYVTFTSDTVRHVVSFIDYKANELFKTELPTLDAMQATPQLMRTRPKAYLLDAPVQKQYVSFERWVYTLSKLPVYKKQKLSVTK